MPHSYVATILTPLMGIQQRLEPEKSPLERYIKTAQMISHSSNYTYDGNHHLWLIKLNSIIISWLRTLTCPPAVASEYDFRYHSLSRFGTVKFGISIFVTFLQYIGYRMPKNFIIVNFGRTVSKSWPRLWLILEHVNIIINKINEQHYNTNQSLKLKKKLKKKWKNIFSKIILRNIIFF